MNFWIAMLLLLFLLHGISSKDIIVAPSSKDTVACGSLDKPCGTIEYAMQKVKIDDVIVLSCPYGNSSDCIFYVNRNIRLYYSVQIKTADNEKHIAQIISTTRGPSFALRLRKVTLTLSNVTVHLSYSMAEVQAIDQAVTIKHCHFILTKPSYVFGIGKILDMVRGNVAFKLNILKSVVDHIADHSRKLLVLRLGRDDNAMQSTLRIVETTFRGNIKLKMSSKHNRDVFIDQIHMINGTVQISGKSLQQSWRSVVIKNSVFRARYEGDVDSQMTLEYLPIVRLENVSFYSKRYTGVSALQAYACDNVIVQNSHFLMSAVRMIIGKFTSMQKTKFNNSYLLMRQFDDVDLSEIFFYKTSVVLDLVQRQIVMKKSKLTESSVDINVANKLDIDGTNFVSSLLKHTLKLFNCSRCAIQNSVISDRHIEVSGSNLQITRCLFNDLHAENGGAIFNVDSNINITDTRFMNTSAEYHGGAIYSTGTRLVKLTTVDFKSSASETKYPALLGNVLYSTSPVELHNVLIDLFTSINSPVLFLKPNDAQECYQGIVFRDQFQVMCPSNHKLKTDFVKLENYGLVPSCENVTYNFYSVSCLRCPYGKYNLGRPLLSSFAGNEMTKYDSVCNECPQDTRIVYKKSEDIFNNTVVDDVEEKLPDSCPVNTIFVINNTIKVAPVIQPINPCPGQRTGAFCKLCAPGTTVSLFTEKCIDENEAKQQPILVFWIAYILTAIVYAILFMFIKELVVWLNFKGLHGEIKRFCKTLFVSYNIDDFFYDDNKILQNNFPDTIDEEFDLVEVNPHHVEITPLNFNIGTTTGVVKILFFFYQVETLLRTHSWAKLEKEIFICSMIRDTISTLFSLRFAYKVDRYVSIPKASLTEVNKEFIKDSCVLFLLLPVVITIVFYVLAVSCSRCDARKKEDDSQNTENSNNSEKKENADSSTSMLLQESSGGESSGNNKEHENTNTDETPRSAPLSPPPKPLRSIVKKLFDRIDGKVPIYVSMPLEYRMKCFTLIIFVLGYLPISVFLFKSVQCIAVNEQYLLWMHPTVSCFNSYQVIASMLIVLWVIPFPFALLVASKMQYTCEIVPNELFASLFFPPLIVYFFVRNRFWRNRRCCNVQQAMLAKHLLMVLYECFRLQKNDRRYDIMWEVAYLFRKLLLVVIAVFAPGQIRLLLVLVLLIVYLLHHLKTKPFSNPALNWLESISLSLLCILCVFNVFWVNQQQSTNDSTPYHHVTQYLLIHAEYVIICCPIILLVLFMFSALVCLICNRTCLRNR